MADFLTAKLDTSEWGDVFAALEGPIKESLARRMAVAGARVIRDEAAANALIPAGPFGEKRRELLSNAMYVAYDKKNLKPNQYSYNVSWNSSKWKGAPHGHLIEFGHWQIYAVYKAENGEWYSNLSVRLVTPKWVPAYPFLRPALDRKGNDALKVMITTGQEELPKLLAEHVK